MGLKVPLVSGGGGGRASYAPAGGNDGRKRPGETRENVSDRWLGCRRSGWGERCEGYVGKTLGWIGKHL